MKIIILTDAEYKCLRSIIGNGWGDGDFEGYAGANKKTQHRAMEKFSSPFKSLKQAQKSEMIKGFSALIKRTAGQQYSSKTN